MLHRLAILSAALLALVPAPVRASDLKVERVVLVMRHGLRAPIDGEVPAGTKAAAPWPRWPVPAEHLTPHGADLLRARGAVDRRWLAAAGVVAPRGCPAADAVRIWTNTAERTIASGRAYAEGLAPGCATTVGHQPDGVVDPLFEPLRAGATRFDAARAVASIEAYTGGLDRLTARHAGAIAELDRILGCGAPAGCSPSAPATVRPSADGHGIDLTGPIRATSGTAQVLLLQYAEGLAGPGTRWPQVAPAVLERLGALHAALFDVFTRPPYMAAHQAGPLARRLLATLGNEKGPRLEVLVGHDTNLTALAAALRVPLDAPGYASGDVAPGGAMAFELVRDRRLRRYVRMTYRTQAPDVMRRGGTAVATTRIVLPGCAQGPDRTCPADLFARRLGANLAD